MLDRTIVLTAAGGVTQQEFRERVEEVLPRRTVAVTGQKLADDQARMIGQDLESMRTGLLVFAAIPLFVGVFVIADTFTMPVAQRTGELTLLRTVGAGRRQVTCSVLAEAAGVAVLVVVNTLAMPVFERSREIGVLRAVGLDRRGVRRMVRLEPLVISLFGGMLVVLGVSFGWAAGELISSSLPTYELVLPRGRLLLFLALAALVGVLAAVWPARRAARLDVLTSVGAE